MNQLLIEMLGNVITKTVSEICKKENIKKYGNRLFCLVEDVVTDSKTKIDDVSVLPVVKILRKSLNIPNEER